MKALLVRLGGWYRKPETQRALLMALAVAGFQAVQKLLEDHDTRIKSLEELRAPLDDVATLADVRRITDERIKAMGPDGRIEGGAPPRP